MLISSLSGLLHMISPTSPAAPPDTIISRNMRDISHYSVFSLLTRSVMLVFRVPPGSDLEHKKSLRGCHADGGEVEHNSDLEEIEENN